MTTRKLLIPLVFVIFSGRQAIACDICGCGVGSQYIGLLPDFKKHIVGFRYRTSSLTSHVGVNGASTYLTTLEKYHTAEAWGAWGIGKSFRVMATLPWQHIQKTSNGNDAKKSGIGDATVQLFYKIVNQKKSLGRKLLVHSLWAGVGLKAPTGQFKIGDKAMNAGSTNLFQLGTGSWDYLFSVMYDIRINDLGLNTNFLYRWNGANTYEYGYGNRTSFSAQLYHKFLLKHKVSLAPNLGFWYEQSKKDIDAGTRVDMSGGFQSLFGIGLEAQIGDHFSVGGNWQRPFSQELASGMIRSNNRGLVSVNYHF